MNNNIVCFGEVLWDVYPDGKTLGGAPFNVAAHLTQLGTQGHIITKVGTDLYGEEITRAIRNQNIETSFTQLDHTFPTGIVNVQLDSNGTPTYDIEKPAAWDFIHTNLENLSLMERCDGLLYGSLACRTERNLVTLKDLAAISKLNICDLNIRQEFYSKSLISELIQMADILKINDDEASLLGNLFGLDDDLYDFLSERFGLNIIILTKGKDGAEAYHEGRVYKADSLKVDVIDTVGSGDAFLAAFIHHFLQGHDLAKCLNMGCELGAFVATKKGAIPKHNTSPKFIEYQSVRQAH